MASTSPYQNNDYQATSTFRPYQLPVNDIVRGISAQNQYWDEGAAKVKNVYDNILDLNLRTTDNKNTRDQFIKDAQSSITKLSGMNLADPGVQRQGINIFQPLMQDENIIGEDYVNKNFNKELGIAENFRQKDNGKEYNPLSANNLKFEQSLLDGPLNKRDGWRVLAGAQSKYTPYTDVSGEMKKIKDTVTAQEMNKAVLSGNSWYIHELKSKGISKDVMLGAIQEMGSPALKAQMAVEGRNTYYNHLQADPAGATTYFKNLATSYYDGKIAELGANKAKLEYEKTMLPKGDEYKGKSDYYDEQVKSINSLIADVNTNQKPKYVESFSNLHDITNLASNVAKVESLWQQTSIDNLAGKLAYQNESFDIKANPAKIAQENIVLATARINQEYEKMQMEHDDKRLDREMEKMKWSFQYGYGGSGNPLLPGTGGGPGGKGVGPYGTQEYDVNGVATKNEGDKRSEAQAAINDAAIPSDEPMRQALISNLLGEGAWQAIQENAPYDKKLTDGVLQDPEFEKAATFMKAYSDKYAGKTIPGTSPQVGALYFTPGRSIADWKLQLKEMPISQFKKWVGNMVKNDAEFTADLVGSNNLSKDPKKAIEFRAAYNKLTSNQLNTSNYIGEQMPKALGDHSRYFTNNGKTNLTDAEITKAYNNYLSDSKPAVYMRKNKYEYYGEKRFLTGSETHELSKEELADLHANKLKNYNPSEDSIITSKLDSDTFKNIIRKKTDQVYLNLRTENNQHGQSYSYDGREKEVMPMLSRMESHLPELQGTDANPDIQKTWDFIKKHPDRINSHDILSPKKGELLPTVRFTMGNFKELAGEEGMVEKVNNMRFKTTGAPAEWSQTNNSASRGRWAGANLVHVPFKSPTGMGSIDITNMGRNIALVEPHIEIKNLYTFDDAGKVRPITDEDFEKAFQSKYNASVSQYLQSNQDEVNKFATEFATNVEARNRLIQEKSKNKK